MLKRLLSVALIVAFFAPLVGCGKKAPADFPKIVPFKVKILADGKAVEGCTVVLSNGKNAAVKGTTDRSGVAVMTTSLSNYSAKGAPEGEFDVQCIKDVAVEHWKTQEEIANMPISERSAYYKEYEEKCNALPREVPKKLADPMTSPLKLTVTAGGEETFDVSEYKDEN